MAPYLEVYEVWTLFPLHSSWVSHHLSGGCGGLLSALSLDQSSRCSQSGPMLQFEAIRRSGNYGSTAPVINATLAHVNRCNDSRPLAFACAFEGISSSLVVVNCGPF